MRKPIISWVLLALLLVAGGTQGAVRFVVLGDAGEGNAAQYQVANAMGTVCAQRGCDFALYLGDNFYPSGVSSAHDAQFISKFEQPYGLLNFPFYVALGNHDYGSAGVEFWKPWYELAYAHDNPASKWKMPSMYYQFAQENVAFFVIDSHGVFTQSSDAAQRQWLSQAMAASTAQWKIVAGHHPYISNGQHGNAGNYEGCPYAFCAPFNGASVKQFVESTVCGQADLYLSGHDHNMQWLQARCGTRFMVSGAGAKTTSFVHRDNNPVYWESDAGPGFMWMQIEGDQLHGVFYNADGTALFDRVETR